MGEGKGSSGAPAAPDFRPDERRITGPQRPARGRGGAPCGFARRAQLVARAAAAQLVAWTTAAPLTVLFALLPRSSAAGVGAGGGAGGAAPPESKGGYGDF